ncbi:Apoptosis-inducing factor 2, partial [Kappamyces sp. JEL0680]
YHECAPRALVDRDFAKKTYFPIGGLASKRVTLHVGDVATLHSHRCVLSSGTTISFDYCVIASGAYQTNTPFVLNQSRSQGLQTFAEQTALVAAAASIVLVGGGPSACELAAEILIRYPNKNVTLVHSQKKLLTSQASDFSRDRLEAKLRARGVQLILDDKVELCNKPFLSGRHTVKTMHGHSLDSDLTFYCVAPVRANTGFLATTYPSALDSRGFVKVLPTLQLQEPALRHMYAVGDVADTGAPKMARYLSGQAKVASKNVVRELQGKTNLATYSIPTWNLMVVTLGTLDSVIDFGFIPGFAKPLLAPIVEFFAGLVKGHSMFGAIVAL